MSTSAHSRIKDNRNKNLSDKQILVKILNTIKKIDTLEKKLHNKLQSKKANNNNF